MVEEAQVLEVLKLKSRRLEQRAEIVKSRGPKASGQGEGVVDGATVLLGLSPIHCTSPSNELPSQTRSAPFRKNQRSIQGISDYLFDAQEVPPIDARVVVAASTRRARNVDAGDAGLADNFEMRTKTSKANGKGSSSLKGETAGTLDPVDSSGDMSITCCCRNIYGTPTLVRSCPGGAAP